ncbi:MAG: hypothetical protein ACE5KU_05570 [Nitrososphaerales archaeon]
MTQLSPRRKALRGLGITLAILGGITTIYAAFALGPASWRYQPGPEELGVAEGETRFQQIGVGFLGVVLIFIGYKTYRFIPYSEREREEVSELDL